MILTDAPAVSSILWNEFLDERKPSWFLDLDPSIQSYLIVRFGPETAWPTATPQTSGLSVTSTQSDASQTSLQSSRPTLSASNSQTSTMSTSTRPSSSASTATSVSSATSAATNPDAPSADDSGLTTTQKVGLGVGIPLGILGLAALLFACGFLCRRRRNRRHIYGSEPPSSPGFIPRFAFQEKSTDHVNHRTPLNPTLIRSSQDLGTMNWEDQSYDPYVPTYAPYVPTYAHTAHMATSNRPKSTPPAPAEPMTMHDANPIMAAVQRPTHSSNRARGRRTSYSSLNSVPEEAEESPVLGRQTTPLQRKRRPTLPMVLEMPPASHGATIKRKAIPESPLDYSPAAQAASESLLRPSLKPVDHSGSDSSGLALSTNSSNGGYHTGPTSPVSPVSQLAPVNPFSNDYAYTEDYGPEYQSGYDDREYVAYPGHGVHRYSGDAFPRKSSKTEWPLRDYNRGSRSKSPMWDRVYEQ
jgi:hypothetical protein